MRKQLGWLWIGVLTCALVAGACGSEDPQVDGRPPGPEVAQPQLVDFGSVVVSGRSVLPFELHNRRDTPALYQVHGVEAPFDVTPQGSFTIEPGASRTIVFGFAPTEAGPSVAKAVVRGGDDELPVVLRGEGVAAEIVCTPDSIDFGPVERGEIVRTEVVCTNHGEHQTPLSAGPLEGEHARLFEYTLMPGLKVPAGASVRIPVAIHNEMWLGPRSATFTLFAGDAPIQAITLRATSIESALELAEGCLDFGHVPPGVVMERPLRLRNVGSRPLIIDRLELASGNGYTIASATPITIQPDDAETEENENEAEILIRFAPVEIGSDPGVLLIRNSSSGTPLAQQALCGFGGGPQLACAASAVDFGPVAVGLPRTEVIVCTNAATGAAEETMPGRLVVESMTTDLDVFSARIVDGNGEVPDSGSTGFAPGASFSIEVTYDPSAESVDTATLTLLTNDLLAPEQLISLRGTGRSLEPCQLALSEQAIDFGVVRPEDSLELALELRNQGTDDCVIYEAQAVTSDGTSAFSASLPEIALVVPGGGRQILPVSVSAPKLALGESSRSLTGELHLTITDPAEPRRTIPLRATSRTPCVVATPAAVDFGVALPGCAAKKREVRLGNACGTPIEIESFEVVAGGSCDEPGSDACPFAIEGPDTAGVSLPLTFTASWAPGALGEEAGVARVRLVGETDFHVVPLRGVVLEENTRTETFVQPSQPKVDVLWVLDNTCSNSAEHMLIGQNLSFFLAAAEANNVDFQLGITTTDTRVHDTNRSMTGGRLVPTDGPRHQRILTAHTPNLADVWAANVQVGGAGDATEKGILAAQMALSPGMIDVADFAGTMTPDDGNLGFMRRDAALEIVFMSDEADQDPAPVADYMDFFRGLKGPENPHLLQFHGILSDPGTGCSGDGGSGTGVRYAELSAATGGVWRSICAMDWSETMSALGQGVFGDFANGYRLGDTPACPGSCDDSIVVRIGTVVVPARSGAIRRWSYDPATNGIIFAPGHRPASGTTVEVTYQAACN